MGRTQLTEHQLELLSLLWDKGAASVQEVHAALPEDRGVALATVATMLNRMCKDGTLERVRCGRHFEYRAVLRREQVQHSMLRRIVDKLFGGDGAALLAHLVREDEVSSEDLRAAQKLISDSES